MVVSSAPSSATTPPGTTTASLSSSSPRKTIGYVVGGVGLALGVVGGVVMSNALSKGNEARDKKDLKAYEDGKTPYYLGLASLIGGGAIAVGGVVLIFTAPNSQDDSTRLWVAPASIAGGSGLAAGGTF
jgi:hypothetical protein